MITSFTILLLAYLAATLFMRQPKFGRKPFGARLRHIEQSPNYKDSQFKNLSDTPSFTEGATMFTVMRDFFLRKSDRRIPPVLLPSRKTDLLALDPFENILVWFGHSSYFIQVDGKKILVDPVFSGNVSPLGNAPAFAGADIYTVDDLPPIDYLVITHDHWDHLDYQTILRIRSKVARVITSLGVGAHLERWGYPPTIINELDWNTSSQLDSGFIAHAMPARHFSGRTFKRNGTLWVSFVLITPTMRLYLGGDSGYDSHFAEIGSKYGPFDIAILEDRQYNKSWKYIHMMPEEVVQAAVDLKAKYFIPVHWAKFSLSMHAWDEPIIRVSREAAKRNVPILHPMIGEKLNLDRPGVQQRWWETVN